MHYPADNEGEEVTRGNFYGRVQRPYMPEILPISKSFLGAKVCPVKRLFLVVHLHKTALGLSKRACVFIWESISIGLHT